jgi:Replicative DNA helicase
MQVREYLSKKGIQVKRERGDELIINCPFCGDKEWKGAVNSTTGAFNCLHLNQCATKLSWWNFQKQLGDTPVHLDNEKSFYNIKKAVYVKPKTVPKKPDSKVIEYLKGRGFTEETIKAFKIGQKDDNIMIPYFKDGEVVQIKYRSIKDKKMFSETDAEPVLFNRDSIDTDALIITEGEYDCMALSQYDIKSVSVPNGASDFRWVDNEWDWLEKYNTVYVCFDDDDAGHKGLQEIVHRLGLWRCKAVTFPYKDANDCLKANISKTEMIECIAGAMDFKPAMLVQPSDFADEVSDLIEFPDKLKGISTGLLNLDELLGGWRNSELTVWSGRNSAGKSTMLNQMFLNLAAKGIKSCIASLEMRVPKYLRWAVLQATCKQYPPRQEVKETLDELSGKIYLINTIDAITPEELLDMFEYAARRYGVKHFLIDSLMKLSFPGKEELKEHKLFINQLTAFGNRFRCHIHLVAHPRKSSRDRDRPGKVDISGTGDITNLADNVLVMFRPDEDERKEGKRKGKDIPDAILYVKKNKELGDEGSIRLRFDPITKRYYDYKKEEK